MAAWLLSVQFSEEGTKLTNLWEEVETFNYQSIQWKNPLILVIWWAWTSSSSPLPFFLPPTLRGVTNKVASRRCQPLSSSFSSFWANWTVNWNWSPKLMACEPADSSDAVRGSRVRRQKAEDKWGQQSECRVKSRQSCACVDSQHPSWSFHQEISNYRVTTTSVTWKGSYGRQNLPFLL